MVSLIGGNSTNGMLGELAFGGGVRPACGRSPLKKESAMSLVSR
jgi:hypothetical protein